MAVLSFFLSPVGRWIAGALALLLVVGGIYLKGERDGADRIQRKWDAAVHAAIERGNKARGDAERSVPDDGVPNDLFDRDKSTVRGVAGD